MRPVRVQMLGFGTFRDETEVDFSDLELVALVGGTGSGKSTIVDAITFALFGRVARIVDARRVAPVINAMSIEARVVLTFELAGIQYRAARVVRRTKTGASTKEARLECGDELVAEGADEVGAQIEQLTGLDFERFTRVVVLPQGKFAAFLHDGKNGRRELLRTVLGLDFYQRLARRARDVSSEAKAQLEVLRPKLEAGGVSDEDLAELEQKREAIAATKRAIDGALGIRQTSIQTRDEATKTAEMFGVLVLAVANVEVPNAVVALGDKLAEAGAAEATAADDLAKADAAVEAASQACNDGPDLGECRRLLGLHADLSASRDAVTELATALEAAVIARDESETRMAELDTAIAQASEAVLEAEVAEKTALDAVAEGPSQAELDRARASLHAVAMIEAEVEPAEAGVATSKEKSKSAASALLAAGDQLSDASVEVRRIENENHAEVLVSSLVQGEACPVCQQTVGEVPALEPSGELSTAATVKAEAEHSLTEARTANANADKQQAAAESQLIGVRNRLEAARQAASDVPAASDLDKQAAEIDQLRAASAAATATREQASAEARTLRDSDVVRAARAEATATASTHTRTEAKLDADEQTAAKLQQQLEGKPVQTALRTMVDQADTLASARAEANAAEKLANQAHQSASQAVAQLQESERVLRQEFTSTWAGFKGIDAPAPQGTLLLDDWRAFADWSTTQQAPLEAEYAKATQVAEAASAKVNEDEQAIRALTNDLDIAEDGDYEIDELSPVMVKLLAQADSGVTAAHARRRELEADVAQVVQLEESQQVHDLLGNRLLKSSGFEQWMMEEVVQALVERASEQLFELSGGQYSIESDDMDFEVRDHRNGDELRDARTLSGGETFLASLALALALADSLHAMAPEGTPPLESLFLDEGFGTLDPETLDVVASAIEELGASGRMVGIITHIRELAERMPVRFEVTKEATSSIVARVEA